MFVRRPTVSLVLYLAAAAAAAVAAWSPRAMTAVFAALFAAALIVEELRWRARRGESAVAPTTHRRLAAGGLTATLLGALAIARWTDPLLLLATGLALLGVYVEIAIRWSRTGPAPSRPAIDTLLPHSWQTSDWAAQYARRPTASLVLYFAAALAVIGAGIDIGQPWQVLVFGPLMLQLVLVLRERARGAQAEITASEHGNLMVTGVGATFAAWLLIILGHPLLLVADALCLIAVYVEIVARWRAPDPAAPPASAPPA